MINKLGCHVSMTSPDFLYGSLLEAISQDANCFMVYTGSPQSIKRQPISKLKIDDLKIGLEKYTISTNDIIIHAPYILNLANSDIAKRKFMINFLNNEIKTIEKIGTNKYVIHPGSNSDKKDGCMLIADIINNINNKKVIFCLETMAGLGNQIGSNLLELKTIIDNVNNKELVGICIDTCHINDAGYNVNNVDQFLSEFDKVIGLKYLKVLHVNDSLNKQGSKKDRHANVGKGTIGLKTLQAWVNHPKLQSICKILETPKHDDIYKKEIHMLLGK